MINIMEVCGTHTMAIARAGIKRMLPEGVSLLSGPGCPVCVTSAGTIDAFLRLAENKNVIITTYGDMIRVPGTDTSLREMMARGSDVRIVYSPMDSLKIARENPGKEVVFLGVGFETTAPGTAATIRAAGENGIKNFSVFSMLKKVEPALRALIAQEDFNAMQPENSSNLSLGPLPDSRVSGQLRVDAFLCPGHVATIIGEKGFRFLTDEYKIPAVIAGFEPVEILDAIKVLLKQLKYKMPMEGGSGQNGICLVNAYKRAVSENGNEMAIKMMDEYFGPCDAEWRGLGLIKESGFKIKSDFKEFDAAEKFGIEIKEPEEKSPCRCGDVICGRLHPSECPMFGKVCTPEEPLGPCMVSSEGTCASYYRYSV